MKFKYDIQVQLPMFCVGGFVAALLILSIHYTKFGDDKSPEVLTVTSGSHTMAVESFTQGVNSPLAPPMSKENLPNDSTSTSEQGQKPDQDPLAEVLKSAAMEGNTVILTQANEAWMTPNSLFDLFLEGFHVGEGIEHLLNHLVVVTEDKKGFEKCKTVHKYCYFLKTKKSNIGKEKVYMSREYLATMWARNKFQRRILKLGYNFLYTDMDILWLRNPLRHIAITSDLAFASDFFYGDEDSLEKSTPNGGFMYVKSSNKTIEFFKSWYEQRVNYPDQHDQYVLNQIKVEFTKRFQVRMQFVNSLYTAGFCEMSKDIGKVCTVHANCCITVAAKLQDLRSILDDWKTYKSIPPWVKEKENFRFRDHGICLHPMGN